MRTIYFDMDGTLADFYGVPHWLDYLQENDTTPYQVANPLLSLSALAKELHKLQNVGFSIGIISWCSKSGTEEFNERTKIAKMEWLKQHLPSVAFDEVYIVPYGTPKEKYADETDVLFDDEEPNRARWVGRAYDVDNILKTLRNLRLEVC